VTSDKKTQVMERTHNMATLERKDNVVGHNKRELHYLLP